MWGARGWALGARRFGEDEAGASRHQTLDFIHPASGRVDSRVRFR